MYKPTRIITTPAGRKQFLEILLNNLLKCKDEFDYWHIWVNTTIKEDIEYIKQIDKNHSFIKAVYPSINVIPQKHPHTIFHFYTYCKDENANYLRLDDDIVFIKNESINTMFTKREHDEQSFLLLGTVLNNSIISHIMQRYGILPVDKIAQYTCLDPVGWEDPLFAEKTHNLFFEKYADGKVEDFYINDWLLHSFEHISVNVICWSGKMFKELNVEVNPKEEKWLTTIAPKTFGRYNKIIGNTLFCHYAYRTQHKYLNKTNILSQYKQISL